MVPSLIQCNPFQKYAVAIVSAVVFFVPFLSYADTNTNTNELPIETVDLYINKHISGEDRGFELSDFLYRVKGTDVDAFVSHDSTISLRPGTYTIEEVVPSGFVKDDWRIGWYGQCESGSEYTTSITIEERHLDFGILYCEADNQYRPENNNDDTNGDNDTATGTLTVSKVIIGTTVTPEQFSFTVNGGNSIAFESDGDNVVDVASGTYTVTEVAATGYTIEYSTECSGTILGGESKSCIITNTWDDGGGNGDPEPELYRIEGYVWHDDNENTQWDGFDDDEATTSEDELISWTVQITNGTDTYSTTTDPNGYYWFEVPAGTWTITEVLEDGWTLITPVSGSFIITVPDGDVQVTFLEKVRNFFVPVAYAAVINTYGPYNFGNNESSSNGGGDDDDDTNGSNPSSKPSGGGSARPQCTVFERSASGSHFVLAWETKYGKELRITQNGVEIYVTDVDAEIDNHSIFVTTDTLTHELTVTRGSKSDTCIIDPVYDGRGGAGNPEPQVLGDQVAIVPTGAPAAGAGGGTPMTIPSPTFAYAVVSRMIRMGRDDRFGS